jgi:hypothetical protein
MRRVGSRGARSAIREWEHTNFSGDKMHIPVVSKPRDHTAGKCGCNPSVATGTEAHHYLIGRISGNGCVKAFLIV